MTTLNLSSGLVQRVLGPVVDFTDLNQHGRAHSGGVPWVEFVKVHADGTSVYAIAGDGTSVAVARNNRSTEPVEFLVHADDVRELLDMTFLSVDLTLEGLRIDVTLNREDGRPRLMEWPTRPAAIFPRVNRMLSAGLERHGESPVTISGETLRLLHEATKRLGSGAGLRFYPRTASTDPIVAAFQDELLVICRASTESVEREGDPVAWRFGTLPAGPRKAASGHDVKHYTRGKVVDPLTHWPELIAGGAW